MQKYCFPGARWPYFVCVVFLSLCVCSVLCPGLPNKKKVFPLKLHNFACSSYTVDYYKHINDFCKAL